MIVQHTRQLAQRNVNASPDSGFRKIGTIHYLEAGERLGPLRRFGREIASTVKGLRKAVESDAKVNERIAEPISQEVVLSQYGTLPIFRMK